MSIFVNSGAKYLENNVDVPTKKALKDALVVKPASVSLYPTATNFYTGPAVTGAELEIGIKYQVVGPNPYNKRNWYALVEKLQNGRIRVS